MDQESCQSIVKAPQDVRPCSWWLCNHEAKPKSNYCGPKCSKKARTAATRKRLKKEAVALKGGCCEQCGYDRCIEALQFHHIDPAAKSFELKAAASKSRAAFLSELEKCKLLCANCHAEEEWFLRASKRGEAIDWDQEQFSLDNREAA